MISQSHDIAASWRQLTGRTRLASPWEHIPGLLGIAPVYDHGHHRSHRRTGRNLIIEGVHAGMRRARLEGRHIGRRPLEIDRISVVRDRASGMSLAQVAKAHRVSRATIHRVLREQARPALEQTA